MVFYLGNRERGFEPHKTPRTACNSPCAPDENLSIKFPKLNQVTLGTCTRKNVAFAYGAHTALCLPQLLARAKVSVCTTVSLAPSADAHDHRALLCPAPCRARAWRQPRTSARATQSCMARPRQATSMGARAREPVQWPHAGDRYRATHRALPACLPPYTQTTS